MSIIQNLTKIVITIFFGGFFVYYLGDSIVNLSTNFPLWANSLIVLQLIIEAIVLLQTLMILIGIIDVMKEKESFFETPAILNVYPELDVYVPIRRVNVYVLEKTIRALKEQDYKQDKMNVFIIDDTPEIELSNSYRDLAEKYNVNYIYDPSNKKFKAGMLNISLPKGKAGYIAFFDFDQIPQPGILTHMVSILEDNPQYSFVQTKKTFRQLTNISKVWSALLYLQFFEVFERTKNRAKAVMFAGSTACFRREDINTVGGVPEETFTEDNNLTLHLLLAGKIGVFSSRVGSIGLVPNGFYAQISQLWRWSHGGTHTLSLHFIKLLRSKKLTFSQKTEFISTLGITPVLVIVYLYILSFIPLFTHGYDSYRVPIGGISSIVLIPVAISTTYVIFATLAIWFDRNNIGSEFKFRHLPGFLLIALASNFLIFTSGIAGLFRILGPESPRGKWSRYIPITRLSIVSLLLGLLLEYYSLKWLFQGLSAAIMSVVLAFTLLPTFFVVLLYKKPTIEET